MEAVYNSAGQKAKLPRPMAGLLWWGYAMRNRNDWQDKELSEVVGRDKISSSSWILASSPLFHK